MKDFTEFEPEIPVEKNVIENNEKIKSEFVMLIDAQGVNLGKIQTDRAYKMSQDVDLDLVVVSDGEVPVCKLMDKKRFEYKKKVSMRKNKNKEVKSKEIRINTEISENDLKTKLRQAEEFLKKGCHLKLSFKSSSRTSGKDLKKIISSFAEKAICEIKTKYHIESINNTSSDSYSISLIPKK